MGLYSVEVSKHELSVIEIELKVSVMPGVFDSFILHLSLETQNMVEDLASSIDRDIMLKIFKLTGYE
jgi:hypothetical protein